MIVVNPIAMTDAAFDDAASNVPEDDNQIYSDLTPYLVGDKVTMTTGVHNNFECLIANTGEEPNNYPVDGSGDLYWLDLGATNRWAMFDSVINNQTTNAGSIEFEVTPMKNVDSIGLLNLSGSSVHIVGEHPVDGVFYDETFSLDNSDNVFDGYSYFFSEIISVSDIVAQDIPPYASGTYKITVDSAGTAAVGEFVYGSSVDLGVSLVGAQPGLESFSTIGDNAFGQTTIIPRANRKLLTIDTAVETYRINDITRVMAEMIDVPSLWVGDRNNSSLIVYGILVSYNPAFGAQGSISFTNYEIQGFI